MPVANWYPTDAELPVGVKQIQAPKEASLKGWWNECRKVYPDLPLWRDICGQLASQATVDEDVIHFKWGVSDVIFISRKRNLR